MTEVTWTRCDVEGGCGTVWKASTGELPGSWETVRRWVVVERRPVKNLLGVRWRHLCSRHRGARVEGQVGGLR